MRKFLCEFKDKSPGSTGLSHLDVYELIGEVEMKDSVKGWVTACTYRSITSEKTYVREKEDFNKKFKITEIYDKPTLSNLGFDIGINVRGNSVSYIVKHKGKVISEGERFRTYQLANLHALLDATKYVDKDIR